MLRRLEPELLDRLEPDDPAAIASRRDLARINHVMLQHRLMARALRDFAAPRLLVDLGSGDGRFLLGVAKRLPHWSGVKAVIADQQDIVSGDTRQGFAKLGWTCEVARGDVFDTLKNLEDGALVTANLFLHHLDDAALSRLFAIIAARARGFVACEPRRGLFALAASHLVFLLGCNAVTRHDAVASVRAGFSGRELARLWPASGTAVSERAAFPFSHLVTARCNAV